MTRKTANNKYIGALYNLFEFAQWQGTFDLGPSPGSPSEANWTVIDQFTGAQRHCRAADDVQRFGIKAQRRSQMEVTP